MKRYVAEMANHFYEDYKDIASISPRAFPGAPRKQVEKTVYMYQRGIVTELDAVKTIVNCWETMYEIAENISEQYGC